MGEKRPWFSKDVVNYTENLIEKLALFVNNDLKMVKF